MNGVWRFMLAAFCAGMLAACASGTGGSAGQTSSTTGSSGGSGVQFYGEIDVGVGTERVH